MVELCASQKRKCDWTKGTDSFHLYRSKYCLDLLFLFLFLLCVLQYFSVSIDVCVCLWECYIFLQKCQILTIEAKKITTAAIKKVQRQNRTKKAARNVLKMYYTILTISTSKQRDEIFSDLNDELDYSHSKQCLHGDAAFRMLHVNLLQIIKFNWGQFSQNVCEKSVLVEAPECWIFTCTRAHTWRCGDRHKHCWCRHPRLCLPNSIYHYLLLNCLKTPLARQNSLETRLLEINSCQT